MRGHCAWVLASLIAACGGGADAPEDATTDAAVDAAVDTVDAAADTVDAAADARTECGLDTDCGRHEVCDMTPTPHACVCAAGYAADASRACTWVGVITNPGFTQQGGWTLHGRTMIDVSSHEVGQVDPGAAVFFNEPEGDPTCGGVVLRVDQPIQMPRRSRAEPLVVEVHYNNDTTTAMATTVGIGHAWHAEPSKGGFGTHGGDPTCIPTGCWWATARSCLGPGEYAPESSGGRGAPLALALTPQAATTCLITSTLYIDRVDIMPAAPGECPEPGTALNGDAEGNGGWTFTDAASIVDGAGAGGSRGVKLHVDDAHCERPTASDPLSLPTTATAISFHARASAGSRLSTSLGGESLQAVASTVGATFKTCIPAYQRGSAVSFLAVLAPQDASSCGPAAGLDAIIDDVAIVDDPSCGTDPYLADGGFESGNTLTGVRELAGSSSVTRVHDAAQAHGGQRALRLAKTVTCSYPSWSVGVVAPPAVAAAGPALTFYYRMPASTTQTLGVNGAYGAVQPRVADGAWHRGVACLDPRIPDRDQPITFSLNDKDPVTCAQPMTEATAFLDDLTVTTDPSCPHP